VHLARVMNYVAILNSMLVIAVWYSYRLYWVTWEEWNNGTDFFEIISNINGFQKTMLIYPIMLLILFGRIHYSIPKTYLNTGWQIFAIFLSSLGFIFFLCNGSLSGLDAD
jgi:hypothetical protein